MKLLLFITTLLLASALVVLLSCDKVDVSDGDVGGTATLPLLPIDLPIFPTDVTLEGLADSVQEAIEDKIGETAWNFLGLDKDDIEDFFDDVEEKLRGASLEILQPGVLSVAIDNQITDAIRDYVKVTNVGVNFEFKNQTDVWVSVPVEFKLYLGDGALAEDWDESVTIPFEDPRVEDGQFIVKPGETIDLSVDNVPHLVDALNNSDTIGVGYKALYRMADSAHGAKWDEIISEFGLCLVEGLIAGSTSNCPDVEELLQWHLTLKKFELVISAETDFDIPEIPGCEDFADEYGLDTLKDACP